MPAAHFLLLSKRCWSDRIPTSRRTRLYCHDRDFRTAVEAPRNAIGADAGVDIKRARRGFEVTEIISADAPRQDECAVARNSHLSPMRVPRHDPVKAVRAEVVDRFWKVAEEKSPCSLRGF